MIGDNRILCSSILVCAYLSIHNRSTLGVKSWSSRCLGLLLALLASCNTLAERLGEEAVVVSSLSVVNNPSFRGSRLSGGSEAWFHIDASRSGFSWGVNAALAEDKGSNSDMDMFLSYSYTTRLFTYTAGFNYVSHFDRSETEAFIQFSGREDFFGFTPRLLLSEEIKNGGTYIEASMSQDIVLGHWLINPHFSMSYGDYFYGDSSKNHIEFGADATRVLGRLGNNFYFSAAINAVRPFSAAKIASGFLDSYLELSVGVVYKFD